MCSEWNKRYNVNIFNLITVINKSKTLIKHISYNGKCKFDGRKCCSNQTWNHNKCQGKCEKPVKHCIYKEEYAWNQNICTWEYAKDFEID